ncbi:hypothetical protein [Chryseobacterium sp. SIMBA_038]|uniref:hypothetical protein n=1 Tax=Chryseobacterium sp. SIMBA_038 TaxID=3085780 RepID=UPI00397C8847
MKKIAYIEIDTHAEIAQDFIEIMQDSNEFEVDYYFSQRIKNQIKESRENIFLSDSSMIMDQLKIKKYDLIIIGTVHRYFNTFQAVTNKFNTAIIVHNINFTNISKSDLIKNILKKDMIYRLKLWWKEGLFYSSKVYKKAKNLLVLDQELASEKYKFLPLFYTKNVQNSENKVLKIVIPGGVSQMRRDYKRVFSNIRKWENDLKRNSNSENKLIEFIFLGKADGNELREIIDLEKSLEQINITYFSERISQNDFEKWMSEADVLWCPIQQETEFFSQKEIYGATKMTGNLGDAIKYGKLAVFPKNYPSKLDFIIPENDNLMEQFIQLKNINFDFQKNYNKKLVQDNLENVLNQLITT